MNLTTVSKRESQSSRKLRSDYGLAQRLKISKYHQKRRLHVLKRLRCIINCWKMFADGSCCTARKHQRWKAAVWSLIQWAVEATGGKGEWTVKDCIETSGCWDIQTLQCTFDKSCMVSQHSGFCQMSWSCPVKPPAYRRRGRRPGGAHKERAGQNRLSYSCLRQRQAYSWDCFHPET